MSRNDKLLEAFAAELKARRNKRGLSQEELARRAVVNRTYIAKMELAKNQPTLCVLNDLAIALNNNLPDLIQGIFSRYQQKQSQRNAIDELRRTTVPSINRCEESRVSPELTVNSRN